MFILLLAMASRAPPATRPGAQRITLRGYIASPDDFGRLRLLLSDCAPGGKHDNSFSVLNRALSGFSAKRPVELGPRGGGCGRGPDDGVVATVTITVPERHRGHWLAFAASEHGSWVTLVATPRSWRNPKNGEQGVSLDVVDIAVVGAADAADATNSAP